MIFQKCKKNGALKKILKVSIKLRTVEKKWKKEISNNENYFNKTKIKIIYKCF